MTGEPAVPSRSTGSAGRETTWRGPEETRPAGLRAVGPAGRPGEGGVAGSTRLAGDRARSRVSAGARRRRGGADLGRASSAAGARDADTAPAASTFFSRQ